MEYGTVSIKMSTKKKIEQHVAESKIKKPFTNAIGYTYMKADPMTQGEFIEMCVDFWEQMNAKISEQELPPSALPVPAP
jgi:hypothetical protein